LPHIGMTRNAAPSRIPSHEKDSVSDRIRLA
jgi:hypothetical protein